MRAKKSFAQLPRSTVRGVIAKSTMCFMSQSTELETLTVKIPLSEHPYFAAARFKCRHLIHEVLAKENSFSKQIRNVTG